MRRGITRRGHRPGSFPGEADRTGSLSAAGFTLLEVLIVVLLIAVIAAILVPMLTESKTSAHESSAIASMKHLASAQALFKSSDKDQDSALDYATSLTELSGVGLIDNVLGVGSKSGYLFSLSGSTHDWRATATPVSESTETFQGASSSRLA